MEIFPIFEMLNIPEITIAKLPKTQNKSRIDIKFTNLLFVNCLKETYHTNAEKINKFAPITGKT